jgi:hypothetical protein
MITRIAAQTPYVAEAEWIRRFFMVSDRLGFEPIEVVTSDLDPGRSRR